MMQQVICDHDAVLVLFITNPAHINQAAPIIVFVNYSLIVLYSPGQTSLILGIKHSSTLFALDTGK